MMHLSHRLATGMNSRRKRSTAYGQARSGSHSGQAAGLRTDQPSASHAGTSGEAVLFRLTTQVR